MYLLIEGARATGLAHALKEGQEGIPLDKETYLQYMNNPTLFSSGKIVRDEAGSAKLVPRTLTVVSVNPAVQITGSKGGIVIVVGPNSITVETESSEEVDIVGTYKGDPLMPVVCGKLTKTSSLRHFVQDYKNIKINVSCPLAEESYGVRYEEVQDAL